jgi:hypothetical protein
MERETVLVVLVAFVLVRTERETVLVVLVAFVHVTNDFQMSKLEKILYTREGESSECMRTAEVVSV